MPAKKNIAVFGFLFIAALTISTTQLAAAEDKNPPELVGFNICPNSINVSTGPAEVTFTAEITDDSSGFKQAWLNMMSPTGDQSLSVTFYANKNRLDNKKDTYRASINFPKSSEPGTWRISGISLKDNAGNSEFYFEQDFMDLGLPTTIKVKSNQKI